ncbi:MAG: AmmeMemoRadiSam system protein A [Kangiellaceae bacterium]|nr:AmmeMemoRadiSam system protein A [Kangiellaceae bacterium]MCW9000431.1 AmmeMemoRadiSam system protein A [Kangiellaceae bacterium]
MPSSKITLKDKKIILDTARHAIQYGLTYQRPPILELETYPKELQENAATFVTLKETNRLRGCIGTIEAYQPLIQDVAEHAYAAAFNDPRFPPVNSIEEPMLHISISLLSTPEELKASSEQELIEKIRPDVDGVILKYKQHKGTFLPSVWEQIKTPEEFVHKLKLKAGLAENFWSDELTIATYQTDVID